MNQKFLVDIGENTAVKIFSKFSFLHHFHSRNQPQPPYRGTVRSKKNNEFESAVISKVKNRFRWYLCRVSGNITTFFGGGKIFLEYSSFAEIFANYGFFQLWENLIFVTWREKMRFFGEKWLFSTNMLDSGQNSL